MGRSRAIKEQMYVNGIIPKSRYESGGEIEHWMQNVHPEKGALHRELHIPQNKKIPIKRLEKASHSSNHLLNKRANLALRYRGL
jgi:hypothetical protein